MDKKAELEEALKGMGRDNLGGLHDDVDNYAKYRRLMVELVDQFRDMNARTMDRHRANNFAEIIKAPN